jgi:hypothetical protein
VVLGPFNHVDSGQHERMRLVLESLFNQAKDGAGLVLGKEEPGAGGSRNHRRYSWPELGTVDNVNR